MTLDSFPVPADQRFFEDYEAGQVYEFGTITVSEAEIIEFARRFDPQYFHVDPREGRGERIWWNHRLGVAYHKPRHAAVFVDHYLSHVASLASPGAEDIRWPNPVRPGDTLRVRVTILEARAFPLQARSRYCSRTIRGDKPERRAGA